MLTPVEVARIARAAKLGATKAATGVKVRTAFGTNEQILEAMASAKEGGDLTLSALGRQTWSFLVPSRAWAANPPVTIALWHLNESAEDSSGNSNTLTLHNTSYVDAKFGKGLSLNGTNAYANCTLSGNEPIRRFLYLAAWVKPAGDGPIIDWPGIAKLYIDSSVLKADFDTETFTGPSITADSWQLCHAQFDSGIVWVGVDDLFTLSEAGFDYFDNPLRDIRIGYDGADYLSAIVDDVLIEADVRIVNDMIVRPKYPSMNDIGHWQFSEGYGLKAHPVGLVGAPIITLANTTWDDGYSGNCIVFDGSAYGTFQTSSQTADNLSIELIMQFSDASGCTLIDQQDGLNLEFTGTHFRTALNGVTNPNSDIAPFTPTLNMWYSITMTYDGSQKAIWVNGQKLGAIDATGTVNIPMNVIHIGETYGGSSRFQGKLDSLLITKHVARPYYRPVRRWLLGRQGFETKEDWVLL